MWLLVVGRLSTLSSERCIDYYPVELVVSRLFQVEYCGFCICREGTALFLGVYLLVRLSKVSQGLYINPSSFAVSNLQRSWYHSNAYQKRKIVSSCFLSFHASCLFVCKFLRSHHLLQRPHISTLLSTYIIRASSPSHCTKCMLSNLPLFHSHNIITYFLSI